MQEPTANTGNTESKNTEPQPAGFNVTRKVRTKEGAEVEVTQPAVFKQRRPKGEGQEGTIYIGFPEVTMDNVADIAMFYGQDKFLRRINNALNAVWQQKYDEACQRDTGEKDAEGNAVMEDCDFQQDKFVEDIQTLHDRTWEGESKADLLKKREVKLAEYSELVAALDPLAMTKEQQEKILEIRAEVQEIGAAIAERSRTKKAKAA